MDQKTRLPNQPAGEAAYEPPRLEAVLTPEEVEREVHYAGEVTQDTLVT